MASPLCKILSTREPLTISAKQLYRIRQEHSNLGLHQLKVHKIVDYRVINRGNIDISELLFPTPSFLYRLLFFKKLAGYTSLCAYSVGLQSGSRVIKSFEELISYFSFNHNVALLNTVRHTRS